MTTCTCIAENIIDPSCKIHGLDIVDGGTEYSVYDEPHKIPAAEPGDG